MLCLVSSILAEHVMISLIESRILEFSFNNLPDVLSLPLNCDQDQRINVFHWTGRKELLYVLELLLALHFFMRKHNHALSTVISKLATFYSTKNQCPKLEILDWPSFFLILLLTLVRVLQEQCQCFFLSLLLYLHVFTVKLYVSVFMSNFGIFLF